MEEVWSHRGPMSGLSVAFSPAAGNRSSSSGQHTSAETDDRTRYVQGVLDDLAEPESLAAPLHDSRYLASTPTKQEESLTQYSDIPMAPFVCQGVTL